jgi:molybdopterin-guanine dinucleotide biosynthesis protein A
VWSAAILAGGRATRFGGRDKSGLVVHGESILRRQLRELAQVAGDVLIVGRHPDRETTGTARVVDDHVPGCGPLGGLHTALTESVGAALVILACDMPYVTAPLLSHLLTLTSEADIVVPRTARGYHPLCAAYTRACLAPATRRLGRGELQMIGLFDDLRVRVVEEDELNRFGDAARLLANVNTPDDYLGIETLHGHKA